MSKSSPFCTAPRLITEATSRLQERLSDVKQPFSSPLSWPVTTASNNCPDLITACLSLTPHHNIAQEIAAIYDHLQEGGLFLGVILGGQTLHELRASLIAAEHTLTGGASPRLVPFPQAMELSQNLTQTGFALPVVDVESVILEYPDLRTLLRDIRFPRDAAHTNPAPKPASRALFTLAANYYATHFATPSGGLAVTADLIFLHGWKENQSRL